MRTWDGASRCAAGSWRSFVGLCRVVLGEPTRDIFCGFKLWRGPAAQHVFSQVSLDGWVFDAEALAVTRASAIASPRPGIVWSDREGSRPVHEPRPRAGVPRAVRRAQGHVAEAAARARASSDPLVPQPADRRP